MSCLGKLEPLLKRSSGISLRPLANSVMSVKGKKVLHIDRNDHYGGFVIPCPDSALLKRFREAASVNIESVCVIVYGFCAN